MKLSFSQGAKTFAESIGVTNAQMEKVVNKINKFTEENSNVQSRSQVLENFKNTFDEGDERVMVGHMLFEQYILVSDEKRSMLSHLASIVTTHSGLVFTENESDEEE